MTRKGVWDLQEVRDKYLESAWVNDPLLFTWGKNEHGQLGHNDRTQRSSPTQVPGTNWNSTQPIHGSSGRTNMSFKTDGTLWAWGNNSSGNLGKNNTTQYSSPVQIPGTTWTATNAYEKNYCTGSNMAAIKTDGTLWMWGSGYLGSLGQNDVAGEYGANYSSPIQVGTNTNWDKTVLSRAIKTDGTLWTWGFNQFGQLGLNDSGTPPSNPDAQQRANSRSSPTQVGTDTTWSVIGDAGYYVYAVKTDGTLWSWGRNNHGCLGHNQGGAWPTYGTPYSSPKQVGSGTDWKQDMRSVTGATESCAGMIKTDGTLYMVGKNNNGCLGQNDTVSRSSPVQIPGTTWKTIDVDYHQAVVATKTDSTAWVWGYSSGGTSGQNQGATVTLSSPTQLPGAWTAVSTMYNSTYGMKNSLTPSQL
tara:strand:- start:43 stop:1287 length:1245 start_codon:yes stop_codon:yes gene_type:complete